MNMKILLNKKASITVALAITAFAVFTSATYAKSIFDIEFPIVELGGCKDKVECKAYCAVEKNQNACENFAASYGIGNAVEKQKERQVRSEVIAKDGGPGNCALNKANPETSCRAYCGERNNMSECVAYAKASGLMKGRELEDAEKVIKALQGGLALPEGCTDEKSCRQTCEEPKNVGIARACFAFAEKVGILPDGIDRERAEKVFKLIEEGKSPFKSPKDFRQCENPANDEIMQKCITFASDNGLMSREDVEIIKKTGGKGPGGCRGKDQCELYCSENQDECMKFAEDNNLIKPEEKARMRDGMLRFKESISNAPEEVKQCLSDVVGADNLEQLIAGKQAPKRDFGDKMRSCFEKSFSGMSDDDSVMMNEGENEREEGRGRGRSEGENRRFNGMMQGGQQGGQRNRSMMDERESPTDQKDKQEERMAPTRRDGQRQDRSRGVTFPPQAQECIKNKIGEGPFNELVAGKIRPDEKLEQAIGGCMQEFGASRTQRDGQSGQDRQNGQDRQAGENEQAGQNGQDRQDGVRPRMIPTEFKTGQDPTSFQQEFQGQQYSDDMRRRAQEAFQGRQIMPFDGMIPSGIPSQGTGGYIAPGIPPTSF